MLYLTADFFPVFVLLGIIGFYRYLIFIIKVIAWVVYEPIQPQEYPFNTPERDVTIVVLRSMPEKNQSIDCSKSQQATANGYWHSKYYNRHSCVRRRRCNLETGNAQIYILAYFEDESIGGVGTSQTVKTVGKRQTVWEVLAGFRLTVRNIEVAASTHIDGCVCCISGRTATYRTVILKDSAFQEQFINDLWRGKYPVNSGDDKFLTRWMVSHGWNTYMQVCSEAELLSTFKTDWRFLKHVLRWTRNTWRSDFRFLFVEEHHWLKHPFVTYTMIDKFVNPLTLLSGPVSVIVLCFIDCHLPVWDIVLSYVIWLLGTRMVKLLPHFFRRPQDIIHLPAFLVFNFYFAIMKVYALFTLNVTDWGTREGVGNELAADIEKNAIAAAASLDDLSQTTIEIPPETAQSEKFLIKVVDNNTEIAKPSAAHTQPIIPAMTLEPGPIVMTA